MSMPELSLPAPILPVIVIEDETLAVPLAETLMAGGLSVIEITFRTAAAAGSIRRIRSALPEMLVGAGTVVTPGQVCEALDAGVHFGLAPGTNPETIKQFHKVGVPFMPGVATPSDIENALKLGCRCLKLFPAQALGGVAYLKALAAPYAPQGVTFCPTGGISLENMNDWLSLPSVTAIGGSWLATATQIKDKRWDEIKQQVQQALAQASRAGSTV